METSKMYERIKMYKKGFVYDKYLRIVKKCKDYKKITVVKMLDEIYKVYNNYKNIIDICTERELKYLKMILDEKMSAEELFNDKYEWERKTLHSKFLVDFDYRYRVFIPDEIIDKVRETIENVNWAEVKKITELNELLVSYCKIQALTFVANVCSFGYMMTDLNEDDIYNHILHNKLFNYYVIVYSKKIPEFDNDILVVLYNDYYSIEDLIDEEREKQGVVGHLQIEAETYKTLFYNEFDINNEKIKNFLEEIKKLPFFGFEIFDVIREFSVLNIDRKALKNLISEIPLLKKCDLTNFFEALDEAMDEMPSGVLNGFTPNQVKMIKAEEIKKEKNKNNIKQKNACLSQQDAKLFYKIYFGLLEFTNNKYQIKPNYKIYNKKNLNPYEIMEIIEIFWENKNAIILEFCLANPYKFNNEELNLASEFKKGIRDLFVIASFYEEYTAVLNTDKTYMIKGINSNLDKIISYKKLPKIVTTTILPFKDVIIYDGLFNDLEVEIGSNIEKMVNKMLLNSNKIYHLK